MKSNGRIRNDVKWEGEAPAELGPDIPDIVVRQEPHRPDESLPPDEPISRSTQLDIDKINNLLQTVATQSCYHPSVRQYSQDPRRHPAHGLYISPTKPTIAYLTVCCDKRIPWLTTDEHHKLLVDIWQDTSHWVVGRYVLMPDHLHLFASPQPAAVHFDSWVKYFKSQFTKRNKDKTCVWQTDFWDVRIRSLDHYEEKSIYMFDNPVRAGLVADGNDWKFMGIVQELRWE